MNTLIEKQIVKLGLKVKDKITGTEGVLINVSFNVFGTVEGLIDVSPEGSYEQSYWMDMKGLEVINKEPVMTQPDFVLDII